MTNVELLKQKAREEVTHKLIYYIESFDRHLEKIKYVKFKDQTVRMVEIVLRESIRKFKNLTLAVYCNKELIHESYISILLDNDYYPEIFVPNIKYFVNSYLIYTPNHCLITKVHNKLKKTLHNENLPPFNELLEKYSD